MPGATGRPGECWWPLRAGRSSSGAADAFSRAAGKFNSLLDSTVMSQAAPTRAFEPARYATFRFTGWTFDEPSATASLSYALDDDLHFTERIALPAGAPPLDGARRAALHAVLDLLHQVAGVSYYKTAAPEHVAVETGPLSARRARLLTDVYVQGLGEYAYRNGLDLAGRLRFAADRAAAGPAPTPLARTGRSLVPIGGGKDSVVALETMRARRRRRHPLLRRRCHRDLRDRRRLRPRAARRAPRHRPAAHPPQRRGRAERPRPRHRGRVAASRSPPPSCTGFDEVVLANERSASQGNLEHDGIEVNHQWSKGVAFERGAARRPRPRGVAATSATSRSCAARPSSPSRARSRACPPTTTRSRAATRPSASTSAAAPRRGAATARSAASSRSPSRRSSPRPTSRRSSARDLLDDPAQLPGFFALCGFEEPQAVRVRRRARGVRRRVPAARRRPAMGRPRGRPRRTRAAAARRARRLRRPGRGARALRRPRHPRAADAGGPCASRSLTAPRVGLWGAGREAAATFRVLNAGAVAVVATDEPVPDAERARFPGARFAHGPETRHGPLALRRRRALARHQPLPRRGARAAERGVQLTTATNLWFAEHHEERVIGITGTKGKSTTAALVERLVTAAGAHAELAGNIGRAAARPAAPRAPARRLGRRAVELPGRPTCASRPRSPSSSTCSASTSTGTAARRSTTPTSSTCCATGRAWRSSTAATPASSTLAGDVPSVLFGVHGRLRRRGRRRRARRPDRRAHGPHRAARRAQRAERRRRARRRRRRRLAGRRSRGRARRLRAARAPPADGDSTTAPSASSTTRSRPRPSRAPPRCARCPDGRWRSSSAATTAGRTSRALADAVAEHGARAPRRRPARQRRPRARAVAARCGDAVDARMAAEPRRGGRARATAPSRAAASSCCPPPRPASGTSATSRSAASASVRRRRASACACVHRLGQRVHGRSRRPGTPGPRR